MPRITTVCFNIRKYIYTLNQILYSEQPGDLEFHIIIYVCSVDIYICMLRIASSAWFVYCAPEQADIKEILLLSDLTILHNYIIIILCPIHFYNYMLRIASSAWCAAHPNMQLYYIHNYTISTHNYIISTHNY